VVTEPWVSGGRDAECGYGLVAKSGHWGSWEDLACARPELRTGALKYGRELGAAFEAPLCVTVPKGWYIVISVTTGDVVAGGVGLDVGGVRIALRGSVAEGVVKARFPFHCVHATGLLRASLARGVRKICYSAHLEPP
jgi:hypothetical protein